jgi:hypothetical protein
LAIFVVVLGSLVLQLAVACVTRTGSDAGRNDACAVAVALGIFVVVVLGIFVVVGRTELLVVVLGAVLGATRTGSGAAALVFPALSAAVVFEILIGVGCTELLVVVLGATRTGSGAAPLVFPALAAVFVLGIFVGFGCAELLVVAGADPLAVPALAAVAVVPEILVVLRWREFRAVVVVATRTGSGAGQSKASTVSPARAVVVLDGLVTERGRRRVHFGELPVEPCDVRTEDRQVSEELSVEELWRGDHGAGREAADYAAELVRLRGFGHDRIVELAKLVR